MNLTSSATAFESILRRHQIPKYNEKTLSMENIHRLITWTGPPDFPFFESVLSEIVLANEWEYFSLWLLIIRDKIVVSSSEDEVKRFFVEEALDHILHFLDHEEPRVRMLCAELVGLLAKCDPVLAYNKLGNHIILRVKDNLQREILTRPVVLGYQKIVELDDTTGWKSLETSICAYRNLLQGCGTNYIIHSNILNSDIFEIFITNGSSHINRHIRQSTYDFIITIINLNLLHNSSYNSKELKSKISFALSLGLDDNWSQVRYAASVASRTFLTALSEEERNDCWSLLLPRLCLNRYFIAEGVKSYSQETWSLIIGTNGKILIIKYIENMITYYLEMCNAFNHMISEAACFAMAELAMKIDTNIMLPYIPTILEALENCSIQESWPIRDAACISTARVIRMYPDFIVDRMETIFVIWSNHLKDPIWSIRDNAAMAFGEILHCNNIELINKTLCFIQNYLSNNILYVKNELTPEQIKANAISFIQPQLLQQLLNHEFNNSNITDLSKNRVRTRADWGCCLDCTVGRESRPWEVSEGCLFLLHELSSSHPKEATVYLEVSYVCVRNPASIFTRYGFT